jgi:hypothetical protein
VDQKDKNADSDKYVERVPLQQLADQGAETLLTMIGRALPDTFGQVAVSAFNSSI